VYLALQALPSCVIVNQPCERYFQTIHTFVAGRFVDCDVGKINKIDVGFKNCAVSTYRCRAEVQKFIFHHTKYLYKNSLPLEAEEE